MTTPHKEGPEYRPEELRKLDAKIAELKGNTFVDVGLRANIYISNQPGYGWTDETPHYSTNIQDAWELFEEMSDNNNWFRIERTYNDWGVSDDVKLYSHGLTAPEAIARAWIRWKESCTSE